MSDFDKIRHQVEMEETQNRVDKAVRFELERFHKVRILPCGILFSQEPATVDYDMIKNSMGNLFEDQNVTVQRAEISKARLFEKDDDGNLIPLTFVKVWYYHQNNKD